MILATLSEELRSIINDTFGQANITGQLDQSVESTSKTIEEYVQAKSTTQAAPNVANKTQTSSPTQNKTKTKSPPPPQSHRLKKTKKMPLEAYIPNLLPPQLKPSTRDDWISTNSFPKMRLISQSGQMNKVYFVFEGEEGYYILDMHAADERINFEISYK